jgi:hypothetical protein
MVEEAGVERKARTAVARAKRKNIIRQELDHGLDWKIRQSKGGSHVVATSFAYV